MEGGISTKKKVITICVAVVAFIIALGITLYPMISTWYNERHQAEVHIHYQEKVEQVDNTKLIEAKELAVAYNQTILPGAQDEDSFSNEALLNAIEDYAGLLNLAGDGIMGYVEIPKIGVSLPIYHGTNNSTLERGVGHLLGSSLPLFSQSVSRQVSSALLSLTSVFEMGTGGPSALSTPTLTYDLSQRERFLVTRRRIELLFAA